MGLWAPMVIKRGDVVAQLLVNSPMTPNVGTHPKMIILGLDRLIAVQKMTIE
jgi:hypothetical protein